MTTTAAVGEIDVDGACLEGGGQILRLSTVFSALLVKNVHVFNIRGGREKGGLRYVQMTIGLQLIRSLCGGNLTGDFVNSTDIHFSPGEPKAAQILADCGTAGSITLMFQVSLPIQLFANGKVAVDCRGGTDVSHAPPIDHTTEVLQPILEKFGVKFECNIHRRGFYPKGQGRVQFITEGRNECLKPLQLTERGRLVKITGRSWVAGSLPIRVAQLMLDNAKSALNRSFPGIPIEVQLVKETEQSAFGNGSGIFLVGHTDNGCRLAGSALGSPKIAAEKVGQEAAEMLAGNINHGGCVDDNIQDQIIVFMALADGTSQVRTGPLTLHTKTAIYIAELFSAVKFEVSNNEDGTVIISCKGLSFNK